MDLDPAEAIKHNAQDNRPAHARTCCNRILGRMGEFK
jgi:hypothetical protein